jgi:hypothetical protein
LLTGLGGGHRGAHPDARTGDLPLRLRTQRDHRLVVVFGLEADTAARLRGRLNRARVM